MQDYLVSLTNQGAGCGEAEAIGGPSDEDSGNWSILSKAVGGFEARSFRTGNPCHCHDTSITSH